jgi:hypothetical protein
MGSQKMEPKGANQRAGFQIKTCVTPWLPMKKQKMKANGPMRDLEFSCGLRLHAGGVFAFFVASVNASSGIVFLVHKISWNRFVY